MISYLLKKFILGLVVLTPLLAIYYVVGSIIDITDTFMLSMVPAQYQPSNVFGQEIPGLGALGACLSVLAVGFIYSSFVGKKVIEFLTSLIERIPIIGAFYKTLGQFLGMVFNDRKKAFSEVVIIDYPRKGIKTLAFVTKRDTKFDKDLMFVFVPTTPNPTSGFFLMVKKTEAQKINLTVDQAFKLVVSAGVIEHSE